MGTTNKFDKSRGILARERFRLTGFESQHPEPDLSLRPALARIFQKLDSQAGSSLQKIQTQWKLIAGKTVAAHSCPGRLSGDILYVYVDSSVWLAEITRFYSDDILGRIQREVGPDTVKALRFQVNPKECRSSLI